MLRSILTAAGAASLVVGIAAYAQAPATPGTPQAAGRSGANVGSLTCNVAGGIGFVFGSSKDLSCLFWRTDGIGERYTGSIKKYGVDLGFTDDRTGGRNGVLRPRHGRSSCVHVADATAGEWVCRGATAPVAYAWRP